MCGLALGDLVRRDTRGGEELHQVRAGEALEGSRVGDLVHAAANEQEAGQGTGRRMVDGLVHLELSVPGAGLEEEVVGQTSMRSPEEKT